MRVRAIADKLTTEQIAATGLGFTDPGESYGVDIGKQYLVYGLLFSVGGAEFGSGIWVNHRWRHYVVLSPLLLFEVVDPRPSRYWEFTYDGRVATLKPPLLRRRFFAEDLGDGEPSAVEEMAELRRRFLVEDGSPDDIID